MKVRKYKNDPLELDRKLKGILKGNTDIELGYKLSFISMVLNGALPKDIAEYCVHDERAIQKWVKIADEQGFDALKRKKKEGRPPLLNPEQKAEIKAVLEDPNSLEEYGYCVWDGKTLSEFIKKWYDVDISVRNCQYLFHELGQSLKTPQTFPAHPENPKVREDFKKKLSELLKDPNNIIVCQDEVHFQLQTNVTRTWCPIGTVPVVGSAPGKESVAYSGFVILGKGNGHLFVTKPERFNYLTTIESIEAFLAAYPMPDSCKIFMIMDNAPWHKKAKRLISEESDARYQQIRNRVTFLPIPPYSPDLNPIEQVWRKARREVTHNTYFPRLNILVDALDSYFSKFARSNIGLATLCTFNFDKPKKKVRIRYTIGNRYAMKISSKRPKPCVALVPYTASNHASVAT